MTAVSVLFILAVFTGSCIVMAPSGPAPLDPDQVLMQQMGQLSEGQPFENVSKVITRAPSMKDDGQWYYYFQKERREPGYPNYKWTGYLIEFSDGKITNIEKLWREL